MHLLEVHKVQSYSFKGNNQLLFTYFAKYINVLYYLLNSSLELQYRTHFDVIVL